ncbi:MAG TPA: rRNA maturation RNase YbeY [Terriglobales bacterium]|nr:rRNA maturation RNase YbeY [Terriglobales bacterium]
MITIEKPSDEVNEKALLRFTHKAIKASGVAGDVCILVTSSREMRRLNRCFRGKDKPTDVISFPAISVVAGKFAGDLAISLDIARSNARRLGHTTDEELRILILHGLLHLAGYDHESDEGEMERKESTLRNKLRLPSSLIARTEAEPGRAQTLGNQKKKVGRLR